MLHFVRCSFLLNLITRLSHIATVDKVWEDLEANITSYSSSSQSPSNDYPFWSCWYALGALIHFGELDLMSDATPVNGSLASFPLLPTPAFISQLWRKSCEIKAGVGRTGNEAK